MNPSVPIPIAARASMLQTPRNALVAALRRVTAVVPRRSARPILGAVRLETVEPGQLEINASDGELSLLTRIPAEGRLACCIVSADALRQRLRNGSGLAIGLQLRGQPERLIVTAGSVEHALPTFDPGDYPPVTDALSGVNIRMPAGALQAGLAVALRGAAQESSRYALEAVLLECDDQGTRLIATDGRRLVIVELGSPQAEFRGSVLIPARLAQLTQRFAEPGEALDLVVDPGAAAAPDSSARISIGSTDWLLHSRAAEGSFPAYREVIPAAGSRFVAPRRALVDAIQAVATALPPEQAAIRVTLSAGRVLVAARSGDNTASSAEVPARFQGGTDRRIQSGFNPGYLLDALHTVPGDEVLFDLQQNRQAANGQVYGLAAILSAPNDPRIRWVVMPVNIDLPPSAASLGSNYRKPLAQAG